MKLIEQINSHEPALRSLSTFVREHRLDDILPAADHDELIRLEADLAKLRRQKLRYGSAESAQFNRLSFRHSDILGAFFDRLITATSRYFKKTGEGKALLQWLVDVRPGHAFRSADITRLTAIVQ